MTTTELPNPHHARRHNTAKVEHACGCPNCEQQVQDALDALIVPPMAFEVQDALVVSDPGYITTEDKIENLRNGAIFAAEPGTWTAHAVQNEYGIVTLALHHESYAGQPLEEAYPISVDSGQMYAGDVTTAPLDYDALLAVHEANEWSRQPLLAFSDGVVSDTPGDGWYPVYAFLDDNGLVAAVEVRFVNE